jgi:hypothetical protein
MIDSGPAPRRRSLEVRKVTAGAIGDGFGATRTQGSGAEIV